MLGAAMVVDLISMILLGIIFVEYSFTNLIAFIGLVVVILLAKKVLIPTFERYKGNRVEIELKIILLLLLSLGILAEQAGVHAALIAFLLGIMLSNIDPDPRGNYHQAQHSGLQFARPRCFFSTPA